MPSQLHMYVHTEGYIRSTQRFSMSACLCSAPATKYPPPPEPQHRIVHPPAGALCLVLLGAHNNGATWERVSALNTTYIHASILHKFATASTEPRTDCRTRSVAYIFVVLNTSKTSSIDVFSFENVGGRRRSCFLYIDRGRSWLLSASAKKDA